MRIATISALVLVCGVPASAADPDPTPALAPFGTESGERLGHIYINLATGERVVTRSDARPARPRAEGGSPDVWLASDGAVCPGGDIVGKVGIVDRPDLDPSDQYFPIATGALRADEGDIGFDTVIDSVSLAYFSAHDDPDAQGVEGFGATWHWYDNDDGYNYCGIHRLPVHKITLTDLPGGPGNGVLGGWDITLDLAGGFDEPQTFELGDTDGDPQGAAFHSDFTGFDHDGDGLHDFSYNVEFHQPGTEDFDGDGVPDGDPANTARTGVRLVTPRGVAVPVPDSSINLWTVDPVDPPPAAQGLKDGFAVYVPYPNGFQQYFGRLWYGGYSCDEQRPFAQAYIEMRGPGGTGGPCFVDLNDDGLLNFFDVQAFLDLYNAGDPLADWYEDGLLNFFDVIAFVNAYGVGCP